MPDRVRTMHRILNILIDLVVNTFFRRIDVTGLENVPATGPLIIAGNHPNALMDGFLLISKCGRWPIHFIANSKLWNYPLLGSLLDALGAVPVHRREEHEGDVDNKDAFERLYEVIESGNCMGVFPEGDALVMSNGDDMPKYINAPPSRSSSPAITWYSRCPSNFFNNCCGIERSDQRFRSFHQTDGSPTARRPPRSVSTRPSFARTTRTATAASTGPSSRPTPSASWYGSARCPAPSRVPGRHPRAERARPTRCRRVPPPPSRPPGPRPRPCCAHTIATRAVV